MARLRVDAWRGGELSVELGDGAFSVGRGLANSLVLRDDPHASLRHAVLEPGPRGYLLRDAGSSNGTWVNGERVSERLLEDGDQLQLGGTVILFET